MSNDQQQFCRPIVLPDVPGEVLDEDGPIWRSISRWFSRQEPVTGASIDQNILSALRTYATEAVRQDRMGRPLTACDSAIATAAIKTLEGMGYSWNGGVLWKPPVGSAYVRNCRVTVDGKELGLTTSVPKPWYPDNSGEWVECEPRKKPAELFGADKVTRLLQCERSEKTFGAGFVAEADRLSWTNIVAYKLVKKHSPAPVPSASTGPAAGQTWYVGFIGQVYRARIERLTDKVAELQVKRPYAPEGEIPQTYAYRRAAVEFIEKVEG